uniref:Uncharacterized protein n=1 Tax=Dulem virus 233 TaxID=3145710 RepID=A0AAU8ATL6_9VIRU
MYLIKVYYHYLNRETCEFEYSTFEFLSYCGLDNSACSFGSNLLLHFSSLVSNGTIPSSHLYGFGVENMYSSELDDSDVSDYLESKKKNK